MPKTFKTLNDCIFFPEGTIEIWYMRPDYFSKGIMGNTENFDPKKPEKTHILLGSTKAVRSGNRQIAEDFYILLQGERWSPQGEAWELIRSKGLRHTSMSVGDFIRFTEPAPEIFMVGLVGWAEIKS